MWLREREREKFTIWSISFTHIYIYIKIKIKINYVYFIFGCNFQNKLNKTNCLCYVLSHINILPNVIVKLQ